VIKTPVSLLLAAVLASALSSVLAQQPAAPAASAATTGASGLTVAPPQAASSQPAPGPAAATPTPTAPAAVAPADTGKIDVAAGEAKFGAICVACHGTGGASGTPANPKLAAQHPAYLVKQLTEFKSGKRPNPIMQGFASQLTEADMKNIAAYLGTQKPSLGFAKDKDLVSLGEQIYRGGNQARALPPAPAATAPTARHSRPNTPACRASTPTTRPASWSPSATASARTVPKCRRSPPN